ncbi:MAG: 16S rRNA (cytosine(1402)-N(4))-methyltransferase RsmH [Gemmatimonadaceae bacterium]|nr:16S rRNA (cytosine(1402)-N(4))-methyltransferase RsmH [Gemmatimonadaceae bacterium]
MRRARDAHLPPPAAILAAPFDSPYHAPVLVDEVLAACDGARLVIDGTLGGGGHTAAFVAAGMRVIALDRDPEAIAAAGARLHEAIADGRVTLVRGNYADVATLPALAGVVVDAVLLDLGVSSHQLDDDARGFSFRPGAPLDMRMGDEPDDAASLLNHADARTLAAWFREYGDEPRAARLAAEIVRRRATAPFTTSDDLVNAIRGALGARTGPGDFARLFQALRIAVNDELPGLARALPALRDRLAPGGVLCVLTYHSGEDRLVKTTFRDWSTACTCPPRVPVCACDGVALGTTLTRKPVLAGDDEVARNVRARSAKLRAWRRAA